MPINSIDTELNHPPESAAIETPLSYEGLSESGIEQSHFNNPYDEKAPALDALNSSVMVAQFVDYVENRLDIRKLMIGDSVNEYLNKVVGLRAEVVKALKSTSAPMVTLNEGEVISVFASASPFSTKLLNEKLSYEETNLIIAERSDATREGVSEIGRPVLETYNTDISAVDPTWIVEQQNELKKAGFTGGRLIEELKNRIQRSYNSLLAKVESRVTNKISEAADAAIASGKTDAQSIKNLVDAGVTAKSVAGLAVVENTFGSNDLLDVRETFARATCVARAMQTSSAAPTSEAQAAQFFDEKVITHTLKQRNQDREALISNGNKLTLTNGYEWPIFIPQQRLGDKIQFRMNPDIVRAFRKGDLHSVDVDQLKLIGSYLKRTNIIDSPMFYTATELAGEVSMRGQDGRKLPAHLTLVNSVINMLEAGTPLTHADAMTLVEVLKTDSRDPAYTSRGEFHDQALKMKNKLYINIDALDLGLRVIADYEDILDRLSAELESGNDLATILPRYLVQVGDNITVEMRQFRDTIQETLIDEGIDPEQIANYLGGDEETIVMDASTFMDGKGFLDQEKVDEMLLKIRSKLPCRVIAFAGTSPTPNDPYSRENEEAHLNYMTALDDGTNEIKSIEKMVRDLNFVYGPEVLKSTNIISMMGYENYVIRKNEMGRWVILDNMGQALSTGTVKKIITNASEYLKANPGA